MLICTRFKSDSYENICISRICAKIWSLSCMPTITVTLSPPLATKPITSLCINRGFSAQHIIFWTETLHLTFSCALPLLISKHERHYLFCKPPSHSTRGWPSNWFTAINSSVISPHILQLKYGPSESDLRHLLEKRSTPELYACRIPRNCHQ